ncbi:MAG: hypothetical protein ACM3OO_04455 [Planctomycetaceae bacterium]
MHPQVELAALIGNRNTQDDRQWREISTGGGEWSPPFEWLEETEALALTSILRDFTDRADDAWFMLWDGWGDLGPAIEGIARGTIHRVPEPPDVPAQLVGSTWAFRHYLVVRGPLDGMSSWFDWRTQGPNYFWPDDRAWIVATEIEGFSTYVGAANDAISEVVASPFLEAFRCQLTDRFDGWDDPLNQS